MKYFISFLVLIIFVISTVDCQKWSTYNRNTSKKQNSKNGSTQFTEGLNGKQSKPTPAGIHVSQPSRRGGVGAWGYIALALTAILSGLGVYYFVIFYPIVCKKERMYDVMDATTV